MPVAGGNCRSAFVPLADDFIEAMGLLRDKPRQAEVIDNQERWSNQLQQFSVKGVNALEKLGPQAG